MGIMQPGFSIILHYSAIFTSLAFMIIVANPSSSSFKTDNGDVVVIVLFGVMIVSLVNVVLAQVVGIIRLKCFLVRSSITIATTLLAFGFKLHLLDGETTLAMFIDIEALIYLLLAVFATSLHQPPPVLEDDVLLLNHGNVA